MTTRETYAERLVQTACSLACRVRDEDPAEIHRDLDRMPDPELIALVTVMAAMIPDDCTPGELLAWISAPPRSREDENSVTDLPRTPSDIGPDPVTVDRCLAGEIPARQLDRAEREQAVRVLHGYGLNDCEIARRMAWHTKSVHRIRSERLGLPAVPINHGRREAG